MAQYRDLLAAQISLEQHGTCFFQPQSGAVIAQGYTGLLTEGFGKMLPGNAEFFRQHPAGYRFVE